MKRTPDIATLLGLFLGVAGIFGAHFSWEGGNLEGILLPPAMLIVFAGTFAAALIGTSMKTFLSMGKMIKLVLFPPTYAMQDAIATLVRFSTVARKDGLLALEKEFGGVDIHIKCFGKSGNQHYQGNKNTYNKNCGTYT